MRSLNMILSSVGSSSHQEQQLLSQNMAGKAEEEEEGGHIDIDKVLHHIGPFGKSQCMQLPLLFCVTFSAGIAVVTFAFAGFVPKYRCLIPECENITTATYYDHEVLPFYTEEEQFTHADYVTLAIGRLSGEPQDVDLVSSKCQRRVVEEASSDLSCSSYIEKLTNEATSTQVVTCPNEQLVFDHSIVLTSATQYYGLTCEQAFVRSLFNSLYMVGMLIGSFIVGIVSDKFGRLKALVLAIILVSGSGLLAAFVDNPILFGISRIGSGMGGMGSYMVPYIIAAEGTLPDYKVYTTMIMAFGFILGELSLGLEAYFIRDWFTLQVVAHAPMLLLLGLYFIVPESTRWLIANGKMAKARQQLKRRARINKAPAIPPDLLAGTETAMIAASKGLDHLPKPTFVDLFKHPTIRLRSLNMFYQWFSVTMGYYGLLFASTSLNGNPHLNFALIVLAELPQMFLYLIFPNLVGRKACLVATQLTSGICCIVGGILLTVPDLAVLQIILVMVGRLGAALGFGMVYLYTAELFPTTIRNTAIGTCSTIARVGGLVALLMESLKSVWLPLPMVIFGSIATMASILALRFPETRNDNLPETMEEALHLGKNVKRNKFGAIITNK